MLQIIQRKRMNLTLPRNLHDSLLKHAVFLSVCLPETVRDTFLVDPAVILIVVGVVMFFITFCGCIGALRENIRLLKTVKFSFNTLLFAFLSLMLPQTRSALEKFARKAIVHYRDDLDLQNLMDYIQKEFKCCGWNSYTDWSWNLYFNCTRENPSTERCAVPYSCCTPVPGETVINTMCGFGVQTQKYLDANKSIYPVGCADRAVMWIETHLLLVGALTLGLALPQVRKPRHTCRVCMGGRTSRRHQKGLTACWRSRAPTE
uniref:Tetraspanin-33 n=1 Tax=Oryzias sinensis TaxID=183150 RepID=A0A8C7XVQ9_9TELE